MNGLSDEYWEDLLERIATQKCTPIIGRGACSPAPPVGCDPAAWNFQYPLNTDMCRGWAKQVGYPFSDAGELARVAHFVSVLRDPFAAREYVGKLVAQAKPPDFQCENEPHRILAELPIEIYLTTNFDSFLGQALARKKEKDQHFRLCRWNPRLPEDPELFQAESDKPTVANPLVYHLFGRGDYPESLVLTEDDSYEFLINLARDEKSTINHWVQRVLGRTTILFVGYSLRDREFLLLFQLLGHFLRGSSMKHIAVQLTPGDTAGDDAEKALKYLNSYFEDFRVRVYWGDCKAFAAELWSRWKARPPTPGAP